MTVHNLNKNFSEGVKNNISHCLSRLVILFFYVYLIIEMSQAMFGYIYHNTDSKINEEVVVGVCFLVGSIVFFMIYNIIHGIQEYKENRSKSKFSKWIITIAIVILAIQIFASVFWVWNLLSYKPFGYFSVLQLIFILCSVIVILKEVNYLNDKTHND